MVVVASPCPKVANLLWLDLLVAHKWWATEWRSRDLENREWRGIGGEWLRDSRN